MRIYGRKADRGKKEAPETVVRRAERPGQAINIDVCFVPEEHAAQEKLPAVSGSSGRLVVGRPKKEGEEPHWPGLIFSTADLEYEEAMLRYVEATRDRQMHPGSKPSKRKQEPQEPARWQEAWERRVERYRLREQRKEEDAAWKAAKAEHKKARQAYQSLTRQERQQQQEVWQATDRAWRQLRQQRQETLQKRKLEDKAWHQRNRELKAGSSQDPAQRAWIAILVVTDNCTRQCLGLPIFRTGSNLTSLELVSALRAILPEELGFVISDQGTHFRSKLFADLAQEADFIHVPVYRHRPESNGIAERFVLTLKNWLRNKTWDGAEALMTLLAAFLPEYNDRPHQGLAIPGLSPNEFAKRIWVM